MKCIHCGAEWNLPPGSQTLAKCPFCQKNLAPEPPAKPETPEAVLREILRIQGREILHNGRMVTACFLDLAPEMKKEHLLLSYLYQFSCHSLLLQAQTQSPGEQQITFARTVRRMETEQFILPEAAEYICRIFLGAMDIPVKPLTPAQTDTSKASVQTDVPPKTVPVSKPPVTKSPVSKPSAAKPPVAVNTYLQYLSALEAYYIQLGRRPLTQQEILSFVQLHNLNFRFGITSVDVRKDLDSIYQKHTPKPVTPPAKKPPTAQITVNTYPQYLSALEDYYIQLGGHRLTQEEILTFVQLHNLNFRFGITSVDVRKDLDSIYRRRPPK